LRLLQAANKPATIKAAIAAEPDISAARPILTKIPAPMTDAHPMIAALSQSNSRFSCFGGFSFNIVFPLN
jgi:hypothetical protein